MPRRFCVALRAATVLLTGCSGASGCTEEFSADLSADTPGAPDPSAALRAWLDGSSPAPPPDR